MVFHLRLLIVLAQDVKLQNALIGIAEPHHNSVFSFAQVLFTEFNLVILRLHRARTESNRFVDRQLTSPGLRLGLALVALNRHPVASAQPVVLCKFLVSATVVNHEGSAATMVVEL